MVWKLDSKCMDALTRPIQRGGVMKRKALIVVCCLAILLSGCKHKSNMIIVGNNVSGNRTMIRLDDGWYVSGNISVDYEAKTVIIQIEREE